MTRLYYTPPSDKTFNEVKEKAMEVWKEIADHPAYLEEKLNSIKNLENIKDNAMYIIAMFDSINQNRLAQKLSKKALQEIVERLEDSGDYLTLSIFAKHLID